MLTDRGVIRVAIRALVISSKSEEGLNFLGPSCSVEEGETGEETTVVGLGDGVCLVVVTRKVNNGAVHKEGGGGEAGLARGKDARARVGDGCVLTGGEGRGAETQVHWDSGVGKPSVFNSIGEVDVGHGDDGTIEFKGLNDHSEGSGFPGVDGGGIRGVENQDLRIQVTVFRERFEVGGARGELVGVGGIGPVKAVQDGFEADCNRVSLISLAATSRLVESRGSSSCRGLKIAEKDCDLSRSVGGKASHLVREGGALGIENVNVVECR